MSGLDNLATKYKEAKNAIRFRQLSAEFKAINEKVSYYSLFKIAFILNDLKQANPQDQDIVNILKTLMNILQGLKKQCNASNAVDEEEIKRFVAQQFMEADDELRSGRANPETIKKLLTASTLIEMTTVFGALTADTEKRMKFAKKMALKLSKNLKDHGDVNFGLEFAPQPTDNVMLNSFAPPPSPSFPQKSPYSPSPEPPRNSLPFAPMPSPSFPLSSSSLQTPELPLLQRINQISTPPFGLDLNSLYEVRVVKDDRQTNNVQNVSVMNSTLYKHNVVKFVEEKIKLQDILKNAIKSASIDLGQAYEGAVNCKSFMVSLLNS